MTRSIRKLTLGVVLAAVALLAVGVGAAGAHGGAGKGRPGLGGESAGKLVTEAATRLGVQRAALVEAIEKAAATRIDEAVEDGDLDADDAADLKDETADDLRLAMSVSRTRVVAANVSKTTTQLNTAFREARKALVMARIDEAVADGHLEADEAAELKDDLDDADLPGYKAGLHGFGGGPGFGPGPGFGVGAGPGGSGHRGR
jgi:hypothetical protein